MRVILVDDEILPIQRLKKLLINCEIQPIEIVGEFTNPLEVLENINELKPDIIFADIEMPVLNGLELAEKIQEIQPDVEVVFITGYDRYAIDAFNVHAIDYMLKPVRKERLHKTMTRLQSIYSNKLITKNNSTLLQLFGGLKVVLADGQVQAMKWRTAKAKEVFAYMVSNHEKTILRDALLEMFWEGVDVNKAVNHLYTTISTIRQTLKKYNLHDISISSPLFDSGYQLQLGNVLVDVHEWRKQLKALPALSNATYEKHEEAVNAYKEHFLNDCDYIWAESEREHLKRLWLQRALELSEFYIKEQKFERAIAIEKKLQKLNIEEESHYFTLMKLYDAIGNKSAVEEQYVLLEKMLKEQLAIEPDVEIISWFQQWKNKQYELKN
ncbi:response regulator [Metasolibacillus fluoroglycofenilyticus]|uniref:response regulator n=1 Tax=Metasolibacillus fluoroglycofenilyticus TaxID=1239396 RepID=UPI000D3D95CA|nr:response regulator [Metasolibacillus fluoroglycofenilyticus]